MSKLPVVSYDLDAQERNIIRMALIYLQADYDENDLEDLSTDGKTLEEVAGRLIADMTPASWASMSEEGDKPPTKAEVKEMQKRREDTGEDLRLFRG